MSAYKIYGDWGTTQLRLWRIERGVPVEFREGSGIGQVKVTPEVALRAAIEPWRNDRPPTRIVLCGMAGARNGLREVSYVECPADADAWRQSASTVAFDGAPLRIGAGIACRGELGRADVMRGEETQVYGAIALQPELGSGSHVAVLPGTHSKWVALTDGRITAFHTFLTGEIFALLHGSSLLASRGTGEAGEPGDGFERGVERAATGAGLLGDLFEVRSAQLRDCRSGAWATDFLSGLLISTEIAERRRLGSLPPEVTVIGGAGLADRYLRALAAFDITARSLVGDACALAGLELLDAHD